MSGPLLVSPGNRITDIAQAGFMSPVPVADRAATLRQCLLAAPCARWPNPARCRMLPSAGLPQSELLTKATAGLMLGGAVAVGTSYVPGLQLPSSCARKPGPRVPARQSRFRSRCRLCRRLALSPPSRWHRSAAERAPRVP
jgi:hypothetical protein